MESYAKSIGIMKGTPFYKKIAKWESKRSGNKACSNSLWTNISIWQLLDRLLFLIQPIAEYTFGMHIGLVLGWLVGLCAGHYYVNHFEPAYFDDLSQLSFWREAPYIFAKHGALTGLVIGVIAIAIINSTLLNQRVTSLFEKKITNPNEIARLLDKSVGQIERKMNKLVKKEKISPKAITP